MGSHAILDSFIKGVILTIKYQCLQHIMDNPAATDLGGIASAIIRLLWNCRPYEIGGERML
jgi:hypothetical protein